MVEKLPENVVLAVGLTTAGFTPARSEKHGARTKARHFERAFGSSVRECCSVFYDLQTLDIGSSTIPNPKLQHFFVALYWLKKYPTEEDLAGITGLHEDTIRKWVWKYAIAIQALKAYKIMWHINNNGVDEDDGTTSWLLSVDGTHCRIQEPRSEPDKDWYSHKHQKPCVSYEIGVHLFESRIVWINGPFKGGEPDINIFKAEDGLKSKIPIGYKVIGDKGYRGDEKVSTNNRSDSVEVKNFKKLARARHEALNGRIKEFAILSDRFRHKVDKHKIAFEAVCVLVQYSLEGNRPLNQI